MQQFVGKSALEKTMLKNSTNFVTSKTQIKQVYNGEIIFEINITMVFVESVIHMYLKQSYKR